MLVGDWMGNIKGLKQRYSGHWISMREWHFLLIKIHKQAANVNGFCEGCWIFTFLENRAQAGTVPLEQHSRSHRRLVQPLTCPFWEFSYLYSHRRPFKNNGVDLAVKAAFGRF